jgi:hypothetical protein
MFAFSKTENFHYYVIYCVLIAIQIFYGSFDLAVKTGDNFITT